MLKANTYYDKEDSNFHPDTYEPNGFTWANLLSQKRRTCAGVSSQSATSLMVRKASADLAIGALAPSVCCLKRPALSSNEMAGRSAHGAD